MKRWLAAPLVMLLPSSAWAACTGSSPTWTTTPDYASVASCVAGATAGDTITVTAGDGNETWDTRLTITKGVNLIGPGAASLTLTNGVACGASDAYVIYQPANYTLNSPLRISGFTFDLNDTCGAIYLIASPSNLTIQTKIRIDHNVFTNAGSSNQQAITNEGMRGVIDHNTFTDIEYPLRSPAGGSSGNWWNNWEGVVFGKTDNAMVFEDNTITSSGTLTDCQFENRYVFRYNTITSSSAANPLFDMHGNAGQYWSCFGGELYGNDITFTSGTVLDQRGGRAAVYYNKVTHTGGNNGIKMREEYCDSENAVTNESAYPQHVNGSYNWANLNANGTVWIAYDGQSPPVCATYTIAANTDWWDYSASYNGTLQGVGCGTKPPAFCTTGDGFWQTTQSCTDLTGLVGADTQGRTSTITGTFYRCTATNTWTAYFTPLAYPHPLISGSVAAPTAPTNVRIR